jgi:2-polyprenyl-3-methyl-5-hydroxy-6-metoxy-1,4-benzoquinol methylase
VSAEPVTRVKSDHYSYTVYADPAMAEAFEPGAIRRAHRRAAGRVAGGSPARLRRNPPLGQTALDVGTGTARAALLLAEAGASVTALDASSEMLRVARGRAAARGAAIRFEVGDAHHLAHADRSFDLAVSCVC